MLFNAMLFKLINAMLIKFSFLMCTGYYERKINYMWPQKNFWQTQIEW